MKQYEYVRVCAKGFVNAIFEDHRDIIDEYAARGFSYAGYIPVKQSNGFLVEIDLIFEKEQE